ncbi:HNH endonuclease [Nocardioides cavernaquae]|uniref:HNH endonuclease n=1 Tax=Nocardioides cavernaquae TaxID=2321396 RepID=A0A3A5HC26_9ACTN|nr:HNH endonuclease [Nocardioides cavernaquae]RJS45610.1 HNH endonuclease [Nocardioides cavernaquae]
MASPGAVFDEMSRSDLLDTAGMLAQVEREAQIDQLRLAVQWAIMNGPDTVDPDRAGLPGRPSMRFYGGHGTPKVATGAGADLGARLGRSTTYGDLLMADGLDIEFRLPEIRGRVEAHEVLPSYARFVAKKTRDLEPDEAAYVDARVAEAADGRVTWSQFESLVEASVIAAAPAIAAAKERALRESRFARATRSAANGMRGFYLRTDTAGVAKLDATVAHIAQVLADLGSTETLDQRRAMAAVILSSPGEAVQLLAAHAAWRDRPTTASDAEPQPEPEWSNEDENPSGPGTEGGMEDPADNIDADPDEPIDPAALDAAAADTTADVIAKAIELWANHGNGQPLGDKPVINWAKVLPTVTLYVHLYGGRVHASDVAGRAVIGADRGEAPPIVRIEGIGAVTEAWLRTHLQLHPDHKLIVKPVIDLEGQAPVDSWEIPDRHREAVRLITPADRFPWATATANQSGGWAGMQIDHTIAWKPGNTGQSRIGNYAPLTQRHHNLKTHGGWQCVQPFPGIYLWRDPHGAYYLVDHTGTRALGDTA